MDKIIEPKAKPSHAINMNSILYDVDGNIMKDSFNAPEGTLFKDLPSLTLGAAVHHALLVKWPDERDLPWDRQFARGQRAYELRNNPEAEIESGELTVIKTLLAKMYGPLQLMVMIPLLDPAAKPGKI